MKQILTLIQVALLYILAWLAFILILIVGCIVGFGSLGKWLKVDESEADTQLFI